MPAKKAQDNQVGNNETDVLTLEKTPKAPVKKIKNRQNESPDNNISPDIFSVENNEANEIISTKTKKTGTRVSKESPSTDEKITIDTNVNLGPSVHGDSAGNETPKPKKPRVKKIAELELPAPIEEQIITNNNQINTQKDINESFVEITTPDLFDSKRKKLSKQEKKDLITNLKRYEPDPEVGLTTDEVDLRILANFKNVNQGTKTKSVPFIIFKNLLSFFNILMFGILGWQISVNAPFANLLFIIAPASNIAIGIIAEVLAKRTLDRLNLLNVQSVFVVRNSQKEEIAVDELVIDDIFLVKNGSQVPADAKIISGMVEVNEALLTGEADVLIKHPGDKIFSGSTIVSGSCSAIVTTVGKDVYINSLTNEAKKYKKPKSSLLSSIRLLMGIVGFLIVPIGVLLFLSMYEGTNIFNFSQTPLSYADTVISVSGAIVGMVPAGLIFLTSISLAFGIIKLSTHKTLVQELHCIEMLARVDTLCLDKTGTITDGTMSVKNIIEYQNPTKLTMKQAISAMINAHNDDNLTTKALVERFGSAKKVNHKSYIPFSSHRKFKAVEFDKFGTFVLGAPEYVITENYEYIARDVEKGALEGYRVLVLGYSNGKIIDNKEVSGIIIPLGLIMIEDTIRADAIQTIQYFNESNVAIRVISGDNPITVSKVAGRAGVKDSDKYISLEGLSDKEVIKAAEKYIVFGRVSPSQKKVLVLALKSLGKTVAMTGDGVNDILALREADCSIALASGSEAASNVSHLVLLDSNFSSMPKVVREGRRVINNIQKAATLFITKTLFSIVLAIIGIFIGFYPIDTSQLLMIDYFIIAFPAFILALESNNTQIKGNFLKNVLKSSFPGAVVIASFSLIVYALRTTLNLDTFATSTIIVLMATFTCVGVLFRVCMPLTHRRKVIFALSLFACLVTTFAVPNLFNFRPFFEYVSYTTPGASVPLELPQILLVIIMIQASYPLMYIITNIPKWIKNSVSSALRKLGSIE